MNKKSAYALADALRLPGEIPAAVDRALRSSWLPNHPTMASDAMIDSLKTAVLRAVALELAVFCKSQNGQFNREHWLDYIAGNCGANGGTKKEAKRG